MKDKFDYKTCTVNNLIMRLGNFFAIFPVQCQADVTLEYYDMVSDFAPSSNFIEQQHPSMEINFDYHNCDKNAMISHLKQFILRELYAFIYVNNIECVKYLLNLLKTYDSWKKILRSSLIADMQFYDFENQEYKDYFITDEMFKALFPFVHRADEIMYSSGIQDIKDNASYVSSSLQNINKVKWRHENQSLKMSDFMEKHIPELEIQIQKYYDMGLGAIESKRLAQMGSSWFVSYMYHFLDPTHLNWVITENTFRTGYFKQTKQYHKRYLEHILKGNEASLGTNKIHLSGAEIKRMAKELLDKWDFVYNNMEYKAL